MPKRRGVLNGKTGVDFPERWGWFEQDGTMSVATYLKKHTEALVKDVGVEAACDLTGKSKATLGRYYSDAEEHDDRFMPIDVVAALEAAAGFPHVTAALADLRGITLSHDTDRKGAGTKGVNQDVVSLSQRFAQLMAEYNNAIGDGVISVNEAKRMLRETLAIQQVLIDVKLHLEEEVS
jgi:class 3 adenylate cyclase